VQLHFAIADEGQFQMTTKRKLDEDIPGNKII